MLMKKLLVLLSVLCVIALTGCQNQPQINIDNNNEIGNFISGESSENTNKRTEEKFIKSGAYSYLDDPNRHYISDVDLSMITDWDVVLPEELDGITMSSFWADDFEENDKITSLTIPASYTAIFGSFKNCKNLKKVIIEASHFQILSDGTFAGCENLEEVILKQDIEIGNNVFENCKNLKTISGPGKIKRIGVQAFKNCINLEKFDTELINDSNIDDEAFYNCIKFDKTILPSAVTFGDNVFGTDDNTYLIETSNSKKIDLILGKGEDIADFKYSKKDLEIAKNEIFARYGHDFDNQELENYFVGQKWYTKIPNKKVSYDDLSEIEKYNVDILNKYIAITKEMEEGNGSSIYYENGVVNVYFKNGMYPEGKEISLKYDYQGNIGEATLVNSVHSDNKIVEGTFHISTSLKNILNNNVKLMCYIDDSLYTEKTVFIDKMCVNFDFNTDLVIKNDNSFEIIGRWWSNTFNPVDMNGKDLKLFDFTHDRNPLNTSFFGDKFIADDGYLYSFDRYSENNIDSDVYCSRISDKKIVNYSLEIKKTSTPDEEFPSYDINITYQYEDGTSYTEMLNYRYYSI